MSNSAAATYRVVVSTDLGGSDPDDIQSLFRLVHYSDILRVEGLVSSPGPGEGASPSADAIAHWVRRVDVDHLRARGHDALMTEAALLAVVRQGQRRPGAPGPGRATDGSRWIVERARGESDRPLWVLAWGCLTDVAQALHDAPDIAGRIRLYSIGSTNTVADPANRDFVERFMRERFPRLWWIENGVMPWRSRDTFRGVYQGGEQAEPWGNSAFVPRFVRGRGSTHDGLFAERCGDAFPLADYPMGSLKEGDSPSMLYLLGPILAGLGDADDPSQDSWGGRFHCPHPDQFPHYHTDLPATPEECQATISRWRKDFLTVWAGRWAWYG